MQGPFSQLGQRPEQERRTSGPAARSPRQTGLILFFVGAGLLALNAFSLTYYRRFYAGAFIVGVPGVLAGPWMAITGRAPSRGLPQPLWWQIVFYTLFGVGLAGGILLAVALRQ
jgi:hypothetical protein